MEWAVIIRSGFVVWMKRSVIWVTCCEWTSYPGLRFASSRLLEKLKHINFCVLALCISFSIVSWGNSPVHFVPDADNDTFRNEVIKVVKAIAIRHLSPEILIPINNLDAKWDNHYQKTHWQVSIILYHDGAAVGFGKAQGKSLVEVLKTATGQAVNQIVWEKTDKALAQYRFEVSFDYFPSRRYSLLEYQQQGLELIGNRVVVRQLTKPAIQAQLHRSQLYLMRAMDKNWHGFFKFYDAKSDQAEILLRTIYSSSSLYTLLKLYAWSPDPKLRHYFKIIGRFILSNQLVSGPNAGGFYYGYNPVTQKKRCKIVVGTTAKSIFTLLELHRFYPKERRYLTAAIHAGNWLLTMVKENGEVISLVDCTSKNWHYKHSQSLLYSGQVLSALSRLYAQTMEKKYYLGAIKIADHFVDLVKREGSLLGDSYRPANSISSSWVLMSLIDFAKINSTLQYRTVLDRVARTILARQIINPEDAYNNGRYLDAMTASGNGWINEVMGTAYQFCKQEKQASCEPYYRAMILTSRWLLQNAYTPQDTYNVKNPDRAIGGFITNFNSPTVRTDAVCHGVNSLLLLWQFAPASDEPLLSLPERPLQEILPLLRAGS